MTALTSSNRTLSKTDFITANSCEAKLFFRENRFPNTKDKNPYLRLLAEGGYMVEALAKARYPAGMQLEYGRDTAADCTRTVELLRKHENITLFEATLASGRCHARVDILEKRGKVFRLLEVKAKSFDGHEHAESFESGAKGVFRRKKKPFDVMADWVDKLSDVTYQTILLKRLFPDHVVEPHLVLVDKSKYSNCDNSPSFFELIFDGDRADPAVRLKTARFIGSPADLGNLDLVTEVNVAEEVAMLHDDVAAEMARRELLLDAPLSAFVYERGAKCKDCEFHHDDPAQSGFHVCWGELATAPRHMLELYSIGTAMHPEGRSLIAKMLENRKTSILDIDEAWLTKKDGTVGPNAIRQRRQIEHTRANTTYIGSELAGKVRNAQYPLHFIDFEACRLALPFHSGMRSYGQVAFQWSCHTIEYPGAVAVHREWLNTRDEWPNQEFANTLHEAVGDTGTLLTWSSFERSVLNEIARDMEKRFVKDAELARWLIKFQARLVDLHDWAKADFYHPSMGGKTSIKVVLDALWKSDMAMREEYAVYSGSRTDALVDPYRALPPMPIDGIDQYVQEGTGAIRAYEHMMYGAARGIPDQQHLWAELLKRYCCLDTLSMVLIYNYWMRLTAVNTA